MPLSEKKPEKGIGLALSGGGFRATLFHVGSLWRLCQLGYFDKFDRISSISGGSITAGKLAVEWESLRQAGFSEPSYIDKVVKPLRDFCSRNVDGPAIGEGALLPWKSISDAVEEEYRKHLFGETKLSEIPAPEGQKPRFVFNATNFATGAAFRFSRPYAADYRIGKLTNPQFRVSLAVTASSAFPPMLSPVVIKKPGTFEDMEGADLFNQPEFHQRLFLTDGGVYDNMGLETVWNRYDTVLVSDAGAPLDATADPGTAWHEQAMRALNVTTSQARALRKRALLEDFRAQKRAGSYWGITTDIQEYQLADALPCKPERREQLAAMRTRLNHFSEQEQCDLINWGYALCDAAMRKYVISTAVPAPQWPYPAYRLDRP